MTERLIVTGLINSTEYLQRVRAIWDSSLLGSRAAHEVADWCLEFYDAHGKAPERHIEDIYYDKKESGDITKDMVDEISDDLEDLAAEYDSEDFNASYAVEQTIKYFKQQHLERHQEQVQVLMERGDDAAAQDLASRYRGLSFATGDDLDLSGTGASLHIENAFTSVSDPLIEYPGALGRMLNQQMIRGGFVSLMASEKRGKSFWLLDMAVRASLRGHDVAFFQAGDMTESQQLRRMASYLNKLPSHDSYAGKVYIPHADCIKNQLDLCDREERRCDFSPLLEPLHIEEARESITKEILVEAWEEHETEYRTCTACPEYREHRLGTPWLIPKNISHAVTVDEAKRKNKKFFEDKQRGFRISSHPNDTLTISKIRETLAQWEVGKQSFAPAVVVIDYADLLVPEKTQEFRHGQNEIWKNLRALSQERDCLVLTATQADAKSYEKNVISMSNYSEDKRKFAHVTAMFGLNQDRHGREKRIGMMRVNQLVVREGDFDSTNTVTVLQCLGLGQPFLNSYI